MNDTITFLRIADVARVTGLARSTIYELVRRGDFPRPIRISARRVAWTSAEVTAWQRARIAAREDVAA